MAGSTIPRRNGAGHVGVHAAYANGDRRKRHPGGMAGVAGSRSGNVDSRLAGGASPVMAGSTGARSDQGVGISGRQPGRSFMTRIARGVRYQVSSRLACSRATVMASIACTLNDALGYPVLKTAGCPVDVQVACIARRCGWNMRRRLSRRPTGGAVASCAIPWGATELALGVAGFAVHPGVGAIQKKARRIVVEG